MVSKIAPKPPGTLQRWGRNLWKAILLGARAGECDLALLETACAMLDRAMLCRHRLDEEGLTVKGRYGQLVSHPLLETERIAMGEFRQCVKLLGLEKRIPKGMDR